MLTSLLARRTSVLQQAQIPSEAEQGFRKPAPVAIVDIGSNSVRLVAYEGTKRSPAPVFNEKMLCGLGRGVMTTGHLPPDGVVKALAALRRFRILCDVMQVGDVHVLATAAARDASNGPEFLEAAQEAIGSPIELLSGAREAQLSALGVISSVRKPDGIVGDMGGGSLELVNIKGGRVGRGITLPLGGLALMDASGQSRQKAEQIVRVALAKTKLLKNLQGRTFYAVGGTWRALAKLHMSQRNYPLHIMHGYVIPAREALEFTAMVEKAETEKLASIGSVSASRRPLLAFGAIVMEEIIRAAKPKDIMISVAGVREGLLYERLSLAERRLDPLLSAAADLNSQNARDPRHGIELCDWTDRLFVSAGLAESDDERRLRHAACLLADIGWRAHPDYRAEHSLDMVIHAPFVGLDHPSRAFLALAASWRHLSPNEEINGAIRALVSPRQIERARMLGAAMRVAYIVSAAMGGVLPRTPLTCTKTSLMLTLPQSLRDLASERLQNRQKQLAKLLGRDAELRVGG